MAYVEIWKVAVLALGPSAQAVVNTFYYGSTAAAGLLASDVATAADATLVTLIQPLVTTDWHYQKCQVICVLGSPIGESGENNNAFPSPGLIPNPSAPIDVTGVGKGSGNTIGRSNRCRKFLSPIAVSDVDADGRYLSGGVHAGDIFALLTAPLPVGVVNLDPLIYNHTSHLGVLIVRASMAAMTGVQKRRRLRLPN